MGYLVGALIARSDDEPAQTGAEARSTLASAGAPAS